MTTVLDRVTEMQDQVIETLSSVNKPMTDAVSTAINFVVENVPEIPTMPFADQIPTPKDFIDNQARFATKLVNTNKAVALSLAGAVQPLTDPLLGRKPAAKSAPKSTASKPAASKTKAA